MNQTNIHENAGDAALFQSIFGQGTVGVAVLDRRGGWVKTNSALCNIASCRSEELLERPLESLFHPEDLARYDESFGAILASSVDYCVAEMRMVRMAAPTAWCRVSFIGQRDSHGRLSQVIVMIEDIGEQKAFEQTMTRLSLQYEAILNAAGEGIIGLDAQGNVMFANPVSAYILGKPVEEIVGRRVSELFSPGGDATWPPTASLAFSSFMNGQGLGESMESQLLTSDGRTVYLSMASAPIMEGNERMGLVVAFRDITNNKQAEVALCKKHVELEAAYQNLAMAQNHLLQKEKLASIGLLAAGLAHGINNPLGYVRSNLGTLERHVQDMSEMIEAYERAEPLLASHPALLEQIRSLKARVELEYVRQDMSALVAESREGLDRVRKIIQNLRDYARIDTEGDCQETDLHACLDGALDLVRNELGSKAVVRKDYGSLPQVECHSDQIGQVFKNILANASQAVEHSGNIAVRTGVDGEMAWVEIEDSGKGIPPEHLSRIFDPFFTTAPNGVGTGLGLSIAHGIVTKHQGQIDVRSEPGAGTAFRIWLPLRRPIPSG